MCFSATASFVAGGALSVAGAETLRHAKTKKSMVLASIPLFFGIQQLVEGVVWSSFNIAWLNALATHVFVFFSHVFWPIYVPLAVLLVENDPKRQRILKVFLLIGLATGLTLFYRVLLIGTPLSCVVGNSIVYKISVPMKFFGIALYLLATCVSCFISSHKYIRLFGIALFGSFLVAYWSYTWALYSVWCFFAALLSFIIYMHFRMNIIKTIKNKTKILHQKTKELIKKKIHP